MREFASKYSAPFPLGNNSGATYNATMGAVFPLRMVHIPQAQRPREDNTAIRVRFSNPNAFMFCI
jgi:hypothetical protein